MRKFFGNSAWPAALCVVVLGIGIGILLYFGHRSHSVPAISEQTPTPITPLEPSNTSQPDAQPEANQAPSQVESPASSSATLPSDTNCYDLSLAQEPIEQRTGDKERRENVKEFLADKFQDQGVEVTLSGSNHQDLNYAALVGWPADEALIRSHADSIKEAMTSSRSKNDFCDADFAKVRFIAIDNARQSIHVLWALSITKDAYRDITAEDEVAHDVAGQGQ